MTERLAVSRDPLVGHLVDGRYLVEGVIGRGGMGVVYAAVHEELQRAVAIKVLNPAWASDADAAARFLREARVASSLSHANIVDVWDLGRLPDGRPYLVMPRIAGEDLGTMLAEEGPQHPRRVVKLLQGVAAALDLIHDKGFVHRDIKPENLLRVVREDGSEAVLVLDFGIAAAVLSESRFTKDGVLCGTPDFLPPEVVSGELPDRRGDVYALATVAFELMTGRLPFQGVNAFQLLTLKLAQPAPSLTSMSGRVFPEALEHVIARGLAQNPDERYATAGEFIHALATAADQAQDELPDLSTAETARNNVRQSAFIRRPQPAPETPSRRERSGGPQVLIVDEDADIEAMLPLRRTGRYHGTLFAFALVLVAGGVYFTLREQRPSQVAEGIAPEARSRAAEAGERPLAPGAAEPAATSTQTPAAAQGAAEASSRALEPAAPASLADTVVLSPTPAAAAAARPPAAAETAEAREPSSRSADRQSRRARAEAERNEGAEPTSAETAPEAAAAPPAPVLSIAPSRAPEAAPAAVPRASEPPAPPGAAPTEAAPAAAEPAPAPEPVRDSSRATELSERATQAMLQGQLTAALTLYQRAVQADREHAAAWRGRGLVLQQLGRPREAAQAFREFLRLSPEGAQSQMIRARLRSIEEANGL